MPTTSTTSLHSGFTVGGADGFNGDVLWRYVCYHILERKGFFKGKTVGEVPTVEKPFL
jgi:hypothetical protein